VALASSDMSPGWHTRSRRPAGQIEPGAPTPRGVRCRGRCPVRPRCGGTMAR
jgi:hypothetical protein